MTLNNIQDAEELIDQGSQDFRLRILLDPPTQLRLYLTFKQKLKIDQFGIGPKNHRVHFLSSYGELILKGKAKGYKVYISRERNFWSLGGWDLEFIKNE